MNAKTAKKLRQLLRKWRSTPELFRPKVTEEIALLGVDAGALVKAIRKENERGERKERNDNH